MNRDMECVLCVKKRVALFDENDHSTGEWAIETMCIGGRIKCPEITIRECDNKITFWGFEDFLEPFDNIISWNIVEKEDEQVIWYIETIELNGCKVFDINDCRLDFSKFN